MSLDSMKEIFDRMEAEHKPFWEIVLETDMDERQVTRQQSMAKMLTTWQYMVDAADDRGNVRELQLIFFGRESNGEGWLEIEARGGSGLHYRACDAAEAPSAARGALDR